MMFRKSSLEKKLSSWIKQGGKDPVSFDYNESISSKAEATLVCSALDLFRDNPRQIAVSAYFSTLRELVSLFQRVDDQAAFEVLRDSGLPILRNYVRDCLVHNDLDNDLQLLTLKILGMYAQRQDVELIGKVAKKQVLPEAYMWSTIFGTFTPDHPFAVNMADELRSTLPTGFSLVSYLDMANSLAIAGKLDRHPFDSEQGRKHLETWLTGTDSENFSYALSATAALPFIDRLHSDVLFEYASNHIDGLVRMEAAWALAKTGNSQGLGRLSTLCLDVNYSVTAQKYLTELNREDQIPSAAQNTDFLAIAEMANWLAHPMEFGQPPDEVELVDSRELFWPPTNDIRRLWLVRYVYSDDNFGESNAGFGLVGSVTFALFGEATQDLSPEDVYGLHCCWELEANDDPRAPDERTAKAGRMILSRSNAGFQA